MDYYSHGYQCVSCGGECSGMGRCDACAGTICAFCAERKDRATFCQEHAPEGSTDIFTAALKRL